MRHSLIAAILLAVVTLLHSIDARSQPFMVLPNYGCTYARDTIFMRGNIESTTEAKVSVGTFDFGNSSLQTVYFHTDSIDGVGFSCDGSVLWPVSPGINYGPLLIDFAPTGTSQVIARLVGTHRSYVDTIILIGGVDSLPPVWPGWKVFWLSNKDFGTLHAGNTNCELLRLVNPAKDTQIVTLMLSPQYGADFRIDTDAISYTLAPSDSNTWIRICYVANKKRRISMDSLVLKFQRIRQNEAFDTAVYYSAAITGQCLEGALDVQPVITSADWPVAYPNPATESVEIPIPEGWRGTIRIKNVLGIPIFTYSTSSSLHWNLQSGTGEKCIPGLYVIELNGYSTRVGWSHLVEELMVR